MTITRIKQRRGTAAAWTAANPTLDSAEFGVETDTGKIKLGDGSTAWTALNYLLEDAALEGTPTAPTAAPGTNTTQVATTAFTKAAVDNATSPLIDNTVVGSYIRTPFVATNNPTMNGDARVCPIFLPTDTPLDRIAIRIVTASSTVGAKIALGIYDDDGPRNRPGTLLVNGGTVAADSAGTKEVTISLTAKGLVWVAAALFDHGASAPVVTALTGHGIAVGGATVVILASAGSVGLFAPGAVGLPGSGSSFTSVAASAPALAVRVA